MFSIPFIVGYILGLATGLFVFIKISKSSITLPW